MFQSIRRIIVWSGRRRTRLYIGCLYSFFHAAFVAMPVMGAAYGLNLILEHSQGRIVLTEIWSLYMLGFMLFSMAGRFWFAYLQATTQESISYETAAEERIAIGQILKRVSLGFFDQTSAGEISAVVTNDLAFIERFAMKMVDVVVNGYINAGTLVVCLALYNMQVALVAAAGIIVSALFLKKLGLKSKENAAAHQAAQDCMIGATMEYLRGMAVVKAFSQEGVAREGISHAYKRSKDINIKIEKGYVPYNCLHLFALKAASTGIVLVSALLTIRGDMNFPTLLMMAIFSFVIFKQIENINNAAHILEMIDVILAKLNRIKTEERIDQEGQDIKLTDYHIQFENVTFAYDQRNILKEVSFNIPANRVTAIVGPSGSGKTTICNLIARFYDIQQGHIRIGGNDIKRLTGDSLLKNITMVFQQVYLFRDTVINNIRFGKPEATFEEVVTAAHKACCHEMIAALPDGYETVIGDGGATLSGGEKQRISIARAILKDSPIVIFDEATASVDPENEHLIQKAMSALMKGKTMIIIAHRLATIQNADQILVVDEGRIAQSGTHGELSRQDGIYKRFLTIRKTAEDWSI